MEAYKPLTNKNELRKHVVSSIANFIRIRHTFTPGQYSRISSIHYRAPYVRTSTDTNDPRAYLRLDIVKRCWIVNLSVVVVRPD